MLRYLAWTISKQLQVKLEATELWSLRTMLWISWTAKKSNETVLQKADTTRSLINSIHKHQATSFGHVMRREKLEFLVITEMTKGKCGWQYIVKRWTNKVAECMMSDRYTESSKGSRCMKGHDHLRQRPGHLCDSTIFVALIWNKV